MAWRQHETGYKPEKNIPSIDEAHEAMHETRKNALVDAVIHSVIDIEDDVLYDRMIQKLRLLGVFKEGQIIDRAIIVESIKKRFDAFFQRNENLPERWKRHLFFEAAELLVATGVLRLNTCRDWQVDRKNPAENVGLQSFEKLEDVLKGKYGEHEGRERMYHLHSGSGDNSTVYRANSKRNTTDKSWRHIGYGNKLYAPIETLIGQFLQPQFRDSAMNPSDPALQIVIRILTEALQKKLHEKWFSPDRGVTEDATWQAASDQQNLNEIFTLLQNPQKLLAGINFPHAVSIHIAKYELSGRFTGDKPVSIAETSALIAKTDPHEVEHKGPTTEIPVCDAVLGAYKILMRLSGMPETLIQCECLEYLEKDAEITWSNIITVLLLAEKAQRACKQKNSNKVEWQEKIIIEATKLLPLAIVKEVESVLRSVDSFEPAIAVLRRIKELWGERKNWIQGKQNGKPENTSDIPMPLPEARKQLTDFDKLLRSERTLLWALYEMRGVKGPLSKKVQKIIDEIFKEGNLQLETSSSTDTSEKLEICLAFVQIELATRHPKITYDNKDVFNNIFEPEFVRAIEKGRPEKITPRAWHLIDRSDLESDQRKTLVDIPKDAFVRANDKLIGSTKTQVSGTDFFIWREGTAIIIDGSNVKKSHSAVHIDDRKLDIQSCFALEITTDLDLNEQPYAYLRNFVPGDFGEIKERFPHGSFSLISAIRSDSHIGDEDFTRLSTDYVHLLRPGGIVITDGIEESYSQVIRLIRSLDPHVAKVEIVMSPKTNRPIALMIQKAHPNGYLTTEEKIATFEEGATFRSPEEVANLRPDLEIRDDVCREIRAVCGHDAFLWVGDQIELDRSGSPSRLGELITAAVVGQKLSKDPTLITPGFTQSIARHLLARDQDASQSTILKDDLRVVGAEALADKLGNFTDLPLHTVWQIRKAIMQVLSPKEITSDMVRIVEKCIVAAYCDTQRDSGGSDQIPAKHPQEITVIERKVLMQQLFNEGRNITYEENPILSQEDIGYIQRRVANRALRMIDKGRNKEDPVGYPLRKTSGVIEPFRRRGSDWELPEVRTTLLRDNHEFSTPEAQERVRHKTEQVRSIAKEIQEVSGHSPIGLIQFTDCVTNDLLIERLRAIFGDDFDTMINTAECTFSSEGEKPAIKDQEIFSDTLATWADKKNRLILGGGSWENAFEPHGKLLKAALRKLFMKCLGEESIRMLGICFMNQILGDMLSNILPSTSKEAITTVGGPLEIGLSRITPTGDGISHPLFKDCGKAFTGIMSRGGYLVGSELHEDGGMMRTLARSGSGGTAAWESIEGKFLGIQWHPEVCCVEEGLEVSSDAEKILAELAVQRTALHTTFELDDAVLGSNFDANRAQIQGDPGTELLLNALIYQLSEIQKNLYLPSSR